MKSVIFHHFDFDIEEDDIEDSSISKLKTTISGYTDNNIWSDIEVAFFDIDKSSISGHFNIEVKTSISKFLRYSTASISKPQSFDIEVSEK